MKLILLILSIGILSNISFSQKNIEINGVKISSQQVSCNIPSEGFEAEMVLLTIENTSDSVKTVRFSYELYYNGICSTCDSSNTEHSFIQVLNAHESVTGECLNRVNDGLSFLHHLPSHLSEARLSSFELTNISVK